MKIIRTVLGDIPADQIGATDAHDHLIRSGGPEIKLDPAFLMDDVETAKKEFGRFLDAGGRTMVCMDPIGCGRNVSKMLEVAKAYEGKGNIVMTTGFQKGGNYCPNTSFLATVDTNIVAKYMIAEVAEGMDLNSYNGPYVERTIAKAGVIKAGTSYRIITKLEQKALAVAAITQKETGCPISMHTDFGTMGSEILDEIEKNGGKSEKTVLCHMQRNPDRYYYSSILDRGATICFDEPNKAAYRPDTEMTMCGEAAFQYVKKAIELAMAGEVDATVTNALNKDHINMAGHHYSGHTEIYADYTHTAKYSMMLAHDELRVIHVSTHVSLRQACDLCKKERVLDVIRIANEGCKALGIKEPKIGVAGLNPHCGENGMFGREEIEEIQPAIDEALAEGINIPEKAPTPPDTVFSKALGGWYDIVVVMYHDQGHIPLKVKGFVYNKELKKWDAVAGVNVTLGLPIIRTSVDHGTGEGHAGDGSANELSLVNAMDYAIRMANAKKEKEVEA